MAKKVHLIIIDGQNDFCSDPNNPIPGAPPGTLYVKGADQDMNVRLPKLIDRIGNGFTDIHATLDCHHEVDIAHPIFWVDKNGQHPAPFTIISAKDVETGKWMTTVSDPAIRQRGLEYVQKLAANKRYPLCIWAVHCRISTPGCNIVPNLVAALYKWETRCMGTVDFLVKGSNPFTEHYSAVKADVPDDQDPSTRINSKFIETLQEADELVWAGEALDFCLRNTFLDVIQEFGVDNLKKFVLLVDATSSDKVPGMETVGDDFIRDMVAKGMRTATTQSYHV